MTQLLGEKPEPYDPYCQRYARDMSDLDDYLEHENQTRVEFVIANEGTYNPDNGHFLCNMCYIRAGMPTGPLGWVCP